MNWDELVHPVFDEDRRQTYFFSASGISVYDQNSQQIVSSCSVNIALRNFPSPVLDKNGRIWVKTELGLSIYYPETNTLSKVLSANPLIDNTRFNDFSSAYKDNNGIFWLGTFGYGILKYVHDQEKFGHISQYNDHPMSLSGVYETPSGEVVVQAYQTKDPVRCDLRKRKFSELFSGFSKTDGDLRNGNSLVFDSNHAYVSHEHIYRLSLGNGSHVKFERPKERPQIIFDPLFIDSKDRMWCADGFPAGTKEFHRIDKQTGQILQTYRFPDSELHHEYRFVSDWKEDRWGNFWFGTLKGVYKFSPDSATWKVFSINPKGNESREGEVVFSLCFDPTSPDSILWIGTNGFGLKKLFVKSGQVESFSISNGLPNNVVYGILSDHRKNLWISTNRGLCLFNPQNGNTRNFTKADGLQADEFNRYAHRKMANGTLLFGGVNGLTCFNPEVFYKVEKSVNTVLTGLRVDNNPVRVGQAVSKRVLLQKPIENTEKIIFPHDVSMVTITFAYMNLANPALNSFQYRLKGFNEEWISTAGLHEATYTNLSPGTFTFEVLGKTNHGNWDEQVAMIELIVLPPWWSTWWFRTLIVLTIAGVLYAFYRYRLAQVVRVERMRNRIAQDLHDEIGSTLSSISLYSAVVQNSSNGMPEKSKAVLEKISNSTTEMMESMNDIVWTIKADNDSFLNVVNRMRAFGVNMTESRGIEFVFEVKGEAERLKLDMDQRKNIYLVFKESINNVLKYAQARHISVAIVYKNSQLFMSVIDDGIGFKVAEAMTSREMLGGNGLRGMQARAKEIGAGLEIESAPGNGTKISLLLQL